MATKLSHYFDETGEIKYFYTEDIFDKGDKKFVHVHIAKIKEEIENLKTAIENSAKTIIVADIAARNAKAETITNGTICWVEDATGDNTVTRGGAAYLANRSSGTLKWDKVTETESLDVVLDWEKVQGKPISSVIDIDDAVTKKHSHANKANLDSLGKSDDGYLTYNGVKLNGSTGIDSRPNYATAGTYSNRVRIAVEEFDDSV